MPVVAFGALLAYEINLDVQARYLATAQSNAEVLAQVGIEPLFTAATVSVGLTPDQVAQVDEKLQGASLDRQVTRLKVWNLGGTIVYSDNHSLIGRTFAIDDDLRAALGGQASGGLTNGQAEENSGDNLPGPLIQVYVPLAFRGTLSTVGAFEMYLPYAPVQAAIDSQLTRLYALLAAGLVLFYISMFPAVAVANRYRRRAEAAAIANLEVMERLNRLKTEFLIRISHQFRTALVGIEGFSEVIRDADTLDLDEVKAFAADIHDDAARLDKAFGQMVELDQIEAGRVALDVGRFDVNTTVESVVGNLRNEYPNREVALNLNATGAEAIFDRTKVSQVLTLLVENAIRLSPGDSTVDVTTTREKNQVRIAVRDHGRAADEANLGLEIARQIVGMHGGMLWQTAAPGGATEFNVTLPVRAAARVAARLVN